MSKLNNSGKKARWTKGKIPGEDYNCSLCGAANWYWDDNEQVCKSRFCPTCGAEMIEDGTYLSLDEAIERISLGEDINIPRRCQIRKWLIEYKELKKRALADRYINHLKANN